MKRKAAVWLLTAALFASLLAGCQSGGGQQMEEASDAEQEEVLTEAPETSDAQTDAVVTSTRQEKARTVITTDGEVDDQDSVIRALLYANDMDIAGIVLTSSMYHYAGDESKGVEPYRWTGTDWIYNFLDAYEAVYDNLKAHDPDYPAPDYLKSVTHIGNIKNKGEMEEVTDGSEFLKALFLDDDPRTLYVQTWGGTNTTARALKSIEEEYADTEQWAEIQDKINRKVVLYIILDQDESYGDYIAQSWPDLMIINDRSNFWHFAYAWQFHSDELNDTLKAAWNVENLLDKGPLMDYYALMGDGKILEGELYEELRGTDDYLAANPNYERYDFISEGDSPSFFYLLDTGLRSLENPSYGGWGGRFGQEGDKLYKNTVVDYNPHSGRYEAQYTLSRWFTDIQNDFAARTDWCLTDDDTAVNHAPTVSVTEGIDIAAAPGETVTLTAVGEDKDGDALSYRWWRYFEADTYQDTEYANEITDDDSAGLLLDLTREVAENEPQDTIEITGANQAQMSFVVPADAKSGDTIHMIAEVQDDGAHTLKHYQRVIITVQ